MPEKQNESKRIKFKVSDLIKVKYSEKKENEWMNEKFIYTSILLKKNKKYKLYPLIAYFVYFNFKTKSIVQNEI